MVFRGGANQRRATNVDLFQQFRQRRLALRCFGERIEIYCDDAEERYIMFRRLGGILFARQDTAKDKRMKCLEAPLHYFGKAGDFGN